MEDKEIPQEAPEKNVPKVEQVLTPKRYPIGLIAALIPMTLALVPMIVYIMIFQYEKGFADYFGIPQDLITLNIATILLVAGLILMVAIFFLYMIIVAPFGFDEHLTKVFRIGIIVLAYIMGVFILILEFNEIWDTITLSSLGPLLIFLGSIWIWSRESLPKQIMPPLCVLVCVAYLTLTTLGMAKAKKAEEFLVAQSNPEIVVLKIYDDNMVCAPFDKEKKELTGGIRLLKLGADPNLIFIREKIGPLKPKYGIYAKTEEDKSGESQVNDK